MINAALFALLAFSPVSEIQGRVSTVSLNTRSIPSQAVEMVGRITYYHRFQDKYGNKVKMDDDLRAKEGVTIAAHPSFPFGTKVYIPSLIGVVSGDGVFIVQDRGKAVTSKKASRGKAFVFDVYIEAKTKLEANKRLNYLKDEEEPYMPVYIIRETQKDAKLQQMGRYRESDERPGTSRNKEKQRCGRSPGGDQPSIQG